MVDPKIKKQIIKLFAAGDSRKYLAEKFNLSKGVISNIINLGFQEIDLIKSKKDLKIKIDKKNKILTLYIFGYTAHTIAKDQGVTVTTVRRIIKENPEIEKII